MKPISTTPTGGGTTSAENRDQGRTATNGPTPASNDAMSIALDGFEYGILADAYRDGRAAFWLKRAEDFERAKPSLDDFLGRASNEELRERWHRCHAIARACRIKASLCAPAEEFDDLVADLGGTR